jgi:hypothetical protein
MPACRAAQFWRQRGEPKTPRILVFAGDGQVFVCLVMFGKPSCTQFAPM